MTEQRPILEICLDSVASAIAAEEGEPTGSSCVTT
jgi:hypothetical protein